jgi:hypothetical protein
MGFAPNDRVKLTPQMAATMMKGMAPGLRRASRVDWPQRRGTVHHVGKQVVLTWDGVKTHDHWPERALEHAD